MQLVALQLELISRDEFRPAFGPVVQRIANRTEVFIEVRRRRKQQARLFEEFADCGAVKIETVRFYAEPRIRVPAAQTGTKFVNCRIIVIDDTSWKRVGSSE